MISMLPRLQSELLFEQLVAALLPSLVNGVSYGDCQGVAGRGYRQYGIDIYCPRAHVAVQCKNTVYFLVDHVEQDVAKSKGLDLPISQFIFATSADNSDANHLITRRLQAEGRFSCRVIYWPEIQAAAQAQPNILRDFWPDLYGAFARAIADRESALRVKAEAPSYLGIAASPQFIVSLAQHDFSGGLTDYQFNEVLELYQELARARDRKLYRDGFRTAEPASGLSDTLLRELEPFMAVLKPFALAISNTPRLPSRPGDHSIIDSRNAYVSFVVHTWHNTNPHLMRLVGS